MCLPTDGKRNEDDEKLPKPYWSGLFHPHMTWVDCLINWIFVLFIPLPKMLNCKPDASEETVAVVRSIDEKMTKMASPAVVKSGIDKWSKFAKCPIGEHVCTIPVQKDILQKWGIITSSDDDDDDDNNNNNNHIAKRDEVRLLVRFPTSLLPSDTKIGEETEGGVVKVADLDLASFALDAVTMLQFHGGGFVIGVAEDLTFLNEVTQLMEHDPKRFEDSKDRSRSLVTISVDYAKAPELPFPNGVIEAMSVVDYLLSSNPDRNLHISAVSAGAGIALPAILEAEKNKFPGRISSVHLHAPFIDPKADTMSYYMMSKVAKYASGAWLRWCWQSYLGMGVPDDDDEIPVIDALTQKQMLQRSSNAAEWANSPWNKAPFNRLARAIEGIPTMKMTDESPSFLIVVNKADSLYSEGMELSKALRKIGASVSLFEHSGVHALGSMVDVKGRAERDEAWLDALFPTN